MKRLLAGLLLIVIFAAASAASNVVNVYNWGGYLPHKVLKMFTKQTGIKVNYSTYNSNEKLYEKLKADPTIGYDVIVPSSYYVQRMAEEGMLHKLNHKYLPNIKNMNPSLMNRSYDPGNQYSVPYLWGTTSIFVNAKYYKPSSVQYWQDFWNKRFAGQLLLVNGVRDVFGMALQTLGYSVNTRKPKQIKAAYNKLLKLLPNVKLFNTNGDVPIYIDGDATVGMVESGDAVEAMSENKHLRFIYPKDGVLLWTDCMSIPKYAPHLKNAYKFINFIMQPKIAKMIAVTLGYSSPNAAAVKLMSKQEQDNPAIYPPKSVLKRAQIEGYLGKKTLNIYLHYWELLKLSS